MTDRAVTTVTVDVEWDAEPASSPRLALAIADFLASPEARLPNRRHVSFSFENADPSFAPDDDDYEHGYRFSTERQRNILARWGVVPDDPSERVVLPPYLEWGEWCVTFVRTPDEESEWVVYDFREQGIGMFGWRFGDVPEPRGHHFHIYAVHNDPVDGPGVFYRIAGWLLASGAERVDRFSDLFDDTVRRMHGGY